MVTLPNFTANAVLTDTFTKIIQNPELRSVDGQQAKLKIGDRIPIATGSFQAGVGVGSVGSAGLVNPLVNTQFQYQDVGVNIDMTPRVHPNHDVSLKIKIEVSSVTGTSTIGGISQPIISQRVVEHDIRLKRWRGLYSGRPHPENGHEDVERVARIGKDSRHTLLVLERQRGTSGRRSFDHADSAHRAAAGLDEGKFAGDLLGFRSEYSGKTRK